MRRSILTREIAPYIFWYLVLISISIGLDIALHMIDMYQVGRYLGIIGSGLFIISFIYSLRKRKIISIGSPTYFLNFHEYLGLLGVVLIIVHAGVHFNAFLPWLTLGLMLIVIASGFTGKRLLKKARASLKSKEADLNRQGLTNGEIEKKLFFDAITVNVMARWRSIHSMISGIFITLAAAHSITILLFWNW
ncbi:hypothetical protein ACFLWR_04655 [Chloroflexota bacterium]